jgi:hypothetical protein
LHERASVWRYMYIVLLNVKFGGKCSRPNHWVLKGYTHVMRTSGHGCIGVHVSVLYSRCGWAVASRWIRLILEKKSLRLLLIEP